MPGFPAALEEWLEALYSARLPKGRSLAAPLAAGVSQGELGAATGAGRSVNAEYLGILTILEGRRKAGQTVSPSVRLAKMQHLI